MSGKSAARHLLESSFPNAFFSKNLITGSQVVIEDVLQILKPMSNSEMFNPRFGSCILKRGGDIVDRIKRSFERCACSDTGPKYYVMLFDKIRYVPMTKGVEQGNRDSMLNSKDDSEEEGEIREKNTSAKRKAKEKKVMPSTDPPDGIGFKKRRPYLTLEDPIPYDISLALSDRDDTLMDIIGFICQNLVDHTKTCRADVPKGRVLILDGHCLSLDICKRLGVGKGQKWAPKDDEEAYSTPIMIEENKISWAEFLSNRLGECDFSSFYLYEKLCEHEDRRLGLDIYTNDTDTMFLGLIFSHKRGESDGIYWRFEPNLTWVLHHREVPTRWPNLNERWADIAELHRSIKGGCFNKPKPKPPKINPNTGKPVVPRKKAEIETNVEDFVMLKDPVLSLVAAMFTMGGDFVDKFPPLNHESALKVIKCYSGYVGDIVEEDKANHSYRININGTSFARFVKSCYMVQKNVRDEDGNAAHPKNATLKDIEKCLGNWKNKTGDFPSTERIQFHAKHLLYYFSLVFQVGDCKALREPDPLMYGYAPRDENNVLSRNNIKRVFSS
jgi:hypothetical protein